MGNQTFIDRSVNSGQATLPLLTLKVVLGSVCLISIFKAQLKERKELRSSLDCNVQG